jgi:hypothetical protein
VKTLDQYLLDHAAATNAAIHLIAEAAGLAVDGLPEPDTGYAALATMADVLYLREGVQAALIELANRLNDVAAALADVASRPPVSVVVPVPDVAVNIALPPEKSAITFARDGAGRIIGAEKTPA